MQLDMKTLVGKLNKACRHALEEAARLTVREGQYAVEVEHLLATLFTSQEAGDITVLARRQGLALEPISADLSAAVERFRRGNTRTPSLSPALEDLLNAAWIICGRERQETSIRSLGLVIAALEVPAIAAPLSEAVPSLAGLSPKALREDFSAIVQASREEMPTPRDISKQNLASAQASMRQIREAKGTDDSPPAPAVEAKSDKAEALEQFTISLTEQAKLGAIDPIIGRDPEIRQLVDILMRRRQNNPILVGEAGVGKTAVVEGFAQRIADGDVPEPLQGVDLRILDVGLLQAGASMKGEFEERLKSVIEAVQASPTPIILFIDEAHTLIGAGGAAGTGDAANLLKPALARGELRTIGATTWAEYKRYIEKDPALARRFQTVKVDEPAEEVAIAMLRGLAGRLAAHHKVRIRDEAVTDAVRLSARYIQGRHLPDKAIGVLDTACARVAVGQGATPPVVEDARRRLDRLRAELELVKAERLTRDEHAERIADLSRAIVDAQKHLGDVEARWIIERNTVKDLKAALEEAPEGEPPGPDAADARERLRDLQGETPMVPLEVDGDVVAGVVSAWTGIPVGRMLRDEIDTVLELEERLGARIIGQDHALKTVARRIRTYRAGLDEPGKPVGVFLFAGPSGVGKTETALALAETLYGGERQLITINMSEFQEPHTVSALKGAPPGYVGYGQGGVLTEAVRRAPYSVVLLDEVEKAHPDVMELFFQVFDKGTLDDGEGVEVDFRNTVIIMTTNLGDRAIQESAKAGEAAEVMIERARPFLVRHFKPAFLGRCTLVAFQPLSPERIRAIVALKIARIARRFAANHKAKLTVEPEILAVIAERCTDTDSGARAIDAIVNHTLLPSLSAAVLDRMAAGASFRSARIYRAESGGFALDFS